MKLVSVGMIGFLLLTSPLALGTGTSDQKGSVFLKLLEPIAPQALKENSQDPSQGTSKEPPEERVTSDLGELLKDPKNESLKGVKVIGKQKRLDTFSQKFMQITWQEVALETPQEGHSSDTNSSLKEPVQKPLESSFVQTAESVESGTPIEAKGDVDSLLAAARTLIIRAQKQGRKGDGVSVSSPQTLTDPRGEPGFSKESSTGSDFASSREVSLNADSLSSSSNPKGSAGMPSQGTSQERGQNGFSSQNPRGKRPSSQDSRTPPSSAQGSSYQGTGYTPSGGPLSYTRSSPSGGGYGLEGTPTQGWTAGKNKKEKGEQNRSQQNPLTVSVLPPPLPSPDDSEGGAQKEKSSPQKKRKGRGLSFSDADKQERSDPEKQRNRGASQKKKALSVSDEDYSPPHPMSEEESVETSSRSKKKKQRNASRKKLTESEKGDLQRLLRKKEKGLNGQSFSDFEKKNPFKPGLSSSEDEEEEELNPQEKERIKQLLAKQKALKKKSKSDTEKALHPSEKEELRNLLKKQEKGLKGQHLSDYEKKNPFIPRQSSSPSSGSEPEKGLDSEEEERLQELLKKQAEEDRDEEDSDEPRKEQNVPSQVLKKRRFLDDPDHELSDLEYDFPFQKGKEKKEKGNGKATAIRIDYDYSACSSRVDWALKQVILQAQAVTFQGQTKLSTSECADTQKKFAIQKDYTHSDCFDLVEKNPNPPSSQDFGFAYATYRPYWLNESHERQYLKEPQKDEAHPFALQEETARCSYAVDIPAKKATPQSELVYENRSKQRVVVEGCRPSLNAQAIDITATRKGCGIVHQFDQNRSMPQQRRVYTVQGIEHEVLPCHDESKTWIKHQFDIPICKPIVDEGSKMQQPFAKRWIQTENGKVIISECEPYGNKTPLLKDAKACSSQPYHHDGSGGQSYVNIRWYYDRQHGKKYVTPCQPSTQAFKHKKTLVGYVHDDGNKLSKPKTEVSFEDNGKKIVVIPAHVDEMEKAAPYIKEGEKAENQPYQAPMRDRCYQEKRFKQKALYKRVDKTVYEQEIQDKVENVDLCKRTKETQDEPAFVSFFAWQENNYDSKKFHEEIKSMGGYVYDWGVGFFFQYGYDISYHARYNVLPSHGYYWKTDRILERIKTVYPTSQEPEYTPWEWSGVYRDHSMMSGISGGMGPYPPFEGKTWHHTERNFVPQGTMHVNLN